MTLELIDFVTETEDAELEDFPPEVQERINRALTGLTDTEEGPSNSPENPPQSITVDADGGGDYESIQPAIDEATSGDVIFVEPGEYSESVTVDIESLTLEGPNAGIDGDNGDARDAEAKINGLVAIDAEQVTVDGFSIERGASGSINQKGVIQIGAVGDSADDAQIVNNGIIPNDTDGNNNASLAGVAIEAADNVTISENRFTEPDESAKTFAVTRYVSDIQNLTVNGNTIETSAGIVFGGTDAEDKSLSYSASITDNQFDTVGTTTQDYSIAVYESETLDVSIEGNNFKAASGVFVTSVDREDAPFASPSGDGEKVEINSVVNNNTFTTTGQVTTTGVGADSTYIVDDDIL